MTRKSFSAYFRLLLMALLPFQGLLGSVEGQEGTGGCQKINKSQDVVFMKFEESRAPKNRGKRDEMAFFRIRNNTTCEVLAGFR